MKEYEALSFEEMAYYHQYPKTTATNIDSSPMPKGSTLGFSTTPDIHKKLEFGHNISGFVDSNASTPFVTPNHKSGGLGINVFEDSVLTPSAFGNNNSFTQNTNTSYATGRRSTVRKNVGRSTVVNSLNFGNSENVQPNSSFSSSFLPNPTPNPNENSFVQPNFGTTTNPVSSSTIGSSTFGSRGTDDKFGFGSSTGFNSSSTGFGASSTSTGLTTGSQTSFLGGFNQTKTETSGFGNVSFQANPISTQPSSASNTSTSGLHVNNSISKPTGFVSSSTGFTSQFSTNTNTSTFGNQLTTNTSSFGSSNPFQSSTNTSSFGTSNADNLGFGVNSSSSTKDTTTTGFGFGVESTTNAQPKLESKTTFGFGEQPTSTVSNSSTTFGFGASTAPTEKKDVGFSVPTVTSTDFSSTASGFDSKPITSTGFNVNTSTTFGFGVPSTEPSNNSNSVTFGTDSIKQPLEQKPVTDENKINVQFGNELVQQSTMTTSHQAPTPVSNLNLSIIENPYGKSFKFTDFMNENEELTQKTEKIMEHAPFYHPIPLVNVNRIRKKKKDTKPIEKLTEMFNTTFQKSENENPNIIPVEEFKPLPSKKKPKNYPILTKEGYFFEPSSKKMKKMDLTKIKNFTITREGCGSIKFLGETNVENLNLDEIVIIEKKSVTVYPNDEDKPESGFGLNKPAIINLYNIYPTLKNTNKILATSAFAQNEIFVEKLKRINLKSKSIFLHYSRETGEWIFKVENF